MRYDDDKRKKGGRRRLREGQGQGGAKVRGSEIIVNQRPSVCLSVTKAADGSNSTTLTLTLYVVSTLNTQMTNLLPAGNTLEMQFRPPRCKLPYRPEDLSKAVGNRGCSR